jgi:hypothetical protein
MAAPMGTLIDSKPSDPMYSEGPQSYSPHWAREFRPKKSDEPPKLPPTKDDPKSEE